MMNFKTGTKVKIHIYSCTDGKEIKTRNYNRVFTIVRKGNKPGIYWEESTWQPLTSFSTENGAVKIETV